MEYSQTEMKNCFHGILNEYQKDGSLFLIDEYLSDGLARVFEAFYDPNGKQIRPDYHTAIEYELVE